MQVNRSTSIESSGVACDYAMIMSATMLEAASVWNSCFDKQVRPEYVCVEGVKLINSVSQFTKGCMPIFMGNRLCSFFQNMQQATKIVENVCSRHQA